MKQNKDLSLSTLSLADFQLPLRPDYGTVGTVVHLRTNYFKMNIDAEKKLFKYTLDLTARYKESRKDTSTAKAKHPAVPPERSRKRRQALALLFEHPDFRAIGHGVATDYGSIIITSKGLPLDENGTKDYIVTYRETEDREPASNPVIYTFKLSYAGLVPMTELLRYLASTPSDPSDFTGKEDAIQALNIIVARTPNFNQGVFQSGNNKFFHYPTHPNAYYSLGGGLIAVRGYYSSVRTSTLRTLLNVNAQTSSFYPAINVVDLLMQHGRDDWLAVEKFIHLLRVKTNYMKHADGTDAVKVKTIFGLSERWDNLLDNKGKVVLDKQKRVVKRRNIQVKPLNSQQVSFECRELGNKTLTIEEYFKEKYSITLGTPEAWVLNCGTRENPVWIPPELCEVMPGQPFRGPLSEQQTSQIMLVAARRPAENARRITNGAQRVIGFQSNNPSLAAFGVGVDPSMIVIKGRILPAPPVTYANKSRIVPTEASWNLKGKKFAKPVKATKWAVLTLGATKFKSEHMVSLREALRTHQTVPDDPINSRAFECPLPGSEDAKDASIQKIFKTMANAGVRMVLVVLPDKTKSTWERVKFWADVKTGIHSICVLQSNLGKGFSYYANLALKWNLKIGGSNQLLPSQLGFLNDGDTMVVGIDVSHPAAKSMEGTPSIAAVVASIDKDYAQWPGSIRCQASKKEMVSTLKLMMQERLKLWINRNERMPGKILIYRDGVSESQYKTVLEEELVQIREACNEVYAHSPQPKINIVVVGKRHHTRFYPTHAGTADAHGNPKNGTVVDRGVTMEKGCKIFRFPSRSMNTMSRECAAEKRPACHASFGLELSFANSANVTRQEKANFLIVDFFLQAHTALQGTAKPSHYVVILDEMKLGAQELQTITHHL